jgi:hypothetical protein
MKRVSVDDITQDLILAKDVCGSSGSILLGKGTTVTPSLSRRLKNWGVGYIYVEGEEVAGAADSTPVISPTELKERLEKKFALVIEHPIMKHIFAAVLQYRLQKN